MRMSNARPQRGSIFTGFLLILLGAFFLLQRFAPHLGIAHLLHRFWPVLLILWGAAKLIDYLTAQKTGADGPPPLLTGSEAALLGLLLVVLLGMAATDWLPRAEPHWFARSKIFQMHADQTQSIPPVPLPPGSRVRIQIENGSVALHGSDEDDLRVSADEEGGGSSESAAQAHLSGLRLAVDRSGQEFFVHMAGQNSDDVSLRVNLDVEVPKQTPVNAYVQTGDVSVSGIAAGIVVRTEAGNVDVHQCRADVVATVSAGDVHISDITGNIALNGRGGDVDISDVSGDAALAGTYTGTVVVRNVAGNTQYAEMRTNLLLAKLTGRVEADAENLKISDVSGPVRVATKDKDVQVENVSGPLEVSNTHGDIDVRFDNPPSQPVNISNGTGDVTLTLPAGSSFQISAVTSSGEVDSEFDSPTLRLQNGDQGGKLTGGAGQNGPPITISTSYGAIHLRKSS
jgi:DUF4097 and DUF4098 domain-containing protein YvlB